jgi:hypothetical protein
MSAKSVVQKFLDSDLAKDQETIDLFHKDCKLNWHSSKGFTEIDYNGIASKLKAIQKSYESFKYSYSHILQDGHIVTSRSTIYVTSIERREKEDALAHFISIWEVKDGKLYKGYEISQLADSGSSSLNSFAEIKV